MPISTISTKGQITLPASARRKLGLKPHDRVLVESTDEAIVIKPVSDLLALKGFLGKALSREKERRLAERAAAARSRGRER